MTRATPRIRHCAECPKCLTRYIVGLSPFRNGSHLVSVIPGGCDEYILYCSCGMPFTATRWHWSEFQACAVSRDAYDCGYGTREEIVTIRVSLENAAGIGSERQSSSARGEIPSEAS